MKTWQIIILLIGGLGVFCLVCISASLVIYTLPEITIESTNAIINQERLSTPIAIATNTLLPTIELSPSHTLIPTDIIPPSLTTIPTNLQTSKFSCVPSQTPQYGIVTKVVDGDTIDVAINNQTFPVRYIGMDTPEMGDSMGSQSKAQNALLVEGKSATLYRDTSETDKYDRLLRYVFVGDMFINYELIKLGYAEAKSYSPDTSCDQYFDQAQKEAQLANLGLWLAATRTSGAQFIPTQAYRQATISISEPCNCSGRDLDCSNFSTHIQAQSCFDYCKSKGFGDIFRLDGTDDDGLACENLP